jgi:hypothetical protein
MASASICLGGDDELDLTVAFRGVGTSSRVEVYMSGEIYVAMSNEHGTRVVESPTLLAAIRTAMGHVEAE